MPELHVLMENISILLKTAVIMVRYQSTNEVNEDMQMNCDLAPGICIWCVSFHYHFLDL